MVVIHVKAPAPEEHEFLYECTCTTTVDELSDAIIEVSDLQSRLQTLSAHLKESSPQVAGAVDRALSEAETYVSKEQVVHKRALLPRVLRGHLQSIEKEVRAAHATGFCDADVLQLFSGIGNKDMQQSLSVGKRLGKRDILVGSEPVFLVILSIVLWQHEVRSAAGVKPES